MFELTALIYNGISQQMVRVNDSSEQAAMEQLEKQFGVHICLWYQCQWQQPLKEALEG